MIFLGMDEESFKKDYFEKRFLFKRNSVNGIEFDISSLEDILNITPPISNKFRLFKDGFIDDKNYTKIVNDIDVKRPAVLKDKFYELINSGATLVLNRLELTSPDIKKLCVSISSFVGFPATANGYFATTGQGTFGNHWDTHDVFAVQLLGKKRWKIYEPTFSLPVSSQTSLYKKADCPKTAIFDDYLNEGDCLYIPRGFWHNAAPTAGETFHIAIGVHTVKIWDYFKWAVAEVLPEVYECRQTLEILSGIDDSASANLAITAKALSNIISDEKTISEYFSACANSSLFNSEFFDLSKNCISRSAVAQEKDSVEVLY